MKKKISLALLLLILAVAVFIINDRWQNNNDASKEKNKGFVSTNKGVKQGGMEVE